MKTKITFVAALLLIIFSCSEGDSNGENASPATEEIEMSGPQLEMNVTSFSLENTEIKLEVINRTESDLKSISGRLVFLDENKAPLTTVTGRQLDSPFQRAENPNVVKAKSKREITLGNKVVEGTMFIRIDEGSATTVDGQTMN